MPYTTKVRKIIRSGLQRGIERAIKLHLPCDHSITIDDILLKLSKQDDICVYCFRVICDQPSLDHRLALINGGHHTLDNLQLTCVQCNLRKGDRLEFQPNTDYFHRSNVFVEDPPPSRKL
jgi:5-methylcytosine-specific restriction endonuclease McrA